MANEGSASKANTATPPAATKPDVPPAAAQREKKPEPGMITGRVAPRRSVQISPRLTKGPGEEVTLPAEEFAELKAGGFVVDAETAVQSEELEPGAKVSQSGANTVSIDRQAKERDGRPSMTTTVR